MIVVELRILRCKSGNTPRNRIREDWIRRKLGESIEMVWSYATNAHIKRAIGL